MITWSLTRVRSGGPRDFVRLFTDLDTGWKGYVGELHLTPAEHDDLTARLAVTTPRDPQRDWLGRTPDEAEAEHTEFVNDILLATPDSWDGDEAATHIAVEYVRELERRVLAAGGSLERWPDEDEPVVIERESIADALENDRCGICGSVGHFREDCPTTVPCARCGKPVPAGQAAHGDCQPIRCDFCTQPTAPHPGPAPYLPAQRQGGESL